MSMAFKGDGLSTSNAILVLWWMVKQKEPMAPKALRVLHLPIKFLTSLKRRVCD